VEEFGKAKEGWLKQYLTLPAGIPSHDTFSRIFRLLDADEFQRRFMRWVERHFSILSGQVIAVDGADSSNPDNRRWQSGWLSGTGGDPTGECLGE
jgi:hypothetical protein